MLTSKFGEFESSALVSLENKNESTLGFIPDRVRPYRGVFRAGHGPAVRRWCVELDDVIPLSVEALARQTVVLRRLGS